MLKYHNIFKTILNMVLNHLYSNGTEGSQQIKNERYSNITRDI